MTLSSVTDVIVPFIKRKSPFSLDKLIEENGFPHDLKYDFSWCECNKLDLSNYFREGFYQRI